MNPTALITTEKKYEHPILIVDKKGNIGESLAKELANELLVVFVSKKEITTDQNIVHVPFVKKNPSIPDNNYSHIFLIDEDLEYAKNTLQAFIRKAKKDDSYFVFISSLSKADDKLLTSATSFYEKTKIILTGDIFLKDDLYDNQTYINKFIYQAKALGRIEIPGDGLRETSPVYFEDVIQGILEIVFAKKEAEKIYYLFPKHKINLLSLSHIFKKIDPNLKIDFIKEKKIKQENFISPKEGFYIFGDTYNLEDKIKKIDFSVLNIENVRKDSNPSQSARRSFSKINLSIIIVFLIFFLSLPLISTIFFSFIGLSSLYLVKSSFEKNNLNASKKYAQVAVFSFKLSQKTSLLLLEEAKVIGKKNNVEEYRKKINSAAELSQGVVYIINASEKLKSVLTGESSDPSKDFYTLITDFKSAFYVYNKEQNSGIIPKTITEKFSDISKITSATIDFWPEILGFNGSKTYLILFQNNMELRPGGGFIGSYAIATLDKGKIINFKIYDVYDADGQLSARVEPPFPIRRHLPLAHWYLRDSNFNVDFSKGAVASAVFLNSEMRQAVDGVIGVDISFIRNLLLITGPVTVSDYKETVNSDNFFQITQSHAEKDFFPGSTQKKDFLRSFYNSLQAKLTEKNNISYLSLLNVLASSIYEKHVLFAFNNPNGQALFAINGFSSALIDDRKIEDNTINDFIGINEANLGANKVNYYITRSLSQKVNISNEGTVSGELTIAIKNTAEKNSWTGGHYKSYLRIITPLNSKLTNIIIDGKEQQIINAITDPAIYEKKNFKIPNGLEVHREEQGNNTIYGFLINLEAKDLRIIQVQYDLDKKVDLLSPKINYSLKIFKQPGVDFFPYEFLLNVPSSLKVTKSTKEIKSKEEKAVFSAQITRDREITISLAQK